MYRKKIQLFEWNGIGKEKINIEDGIGLTMPRAEPLKTR
jgi:hypothetical protein